MGTASQTNAGNPEEAPRESKRKAASSEIHPSFTSVETALKLTKVAMAKATSAIRIETRSSDAPGLTRIVEMMNDLDAALKGIFTNEGKLVSPLPKLSSKKPKNERSEQPATVDASTDTILTPSWWDSDSATEARVASRRRKARSAAGVGVLSVATNGGEESAIETDTEKWTTVVKKPSKPKNPAPAESRTTTARPKG